MTPPPSFRLEATPLDPGVTLIEASAGTGKTFTIAGLFLRLLLERDLSVREILVVTFTEAATEELRDRIRRTLTEASHTLRHGTVEDSPLAALLKPHRAQSEKMLARLDRALSGFDEAPIFTIHGFAQRTLKDRAFESGTLFDTDLLKDDTDLLQEVADDFWRRQFYDAPRLEVSCALAGQFAPATFLELQRLSSRHSQLRILSRLEGASLATVTGKLHAAFSRASTLWNDQRDAILDAFGTGENWAKENHRKPEFLTDALHGASRCFGEGGPSPESLEAIEFFAENALADATRKKCNPPRHPFFTACEVFNRARADFATALKLACLHYSAAELPRRKRRLKVQTFDDLLTHLHQALHGNAGESLGRQLRKRYQAALIDEFQDTDPVQYQNFHKIFVTPDGSSTSLLFLIGDPKQAIYGFRGADIFTYLDAARAASRRYTLDRNWRSESSLVAAVNTLFNRSPLPFLFDAIPFQPVIAAGHADKDPLTEDGRRTPPLRLWFVPRETDAKSIPVAYGETELPRRVASEIVRLLNGPTVIGTRQVTPGDIAVLVRKRKQARWIQDALREVAVPAVLHTEESVFESGEAVELARWLGAVARPQDERRIRAALVTELIGRTGDELDRIGQDDRQWQVVVQEFHDLHSLWNARGFAPMFRRWMQLSGVRQRLLRLTDGERRLTNVLHLGELIHQAAEERRLTPDPLVRWLEEQIGATDRGAEENQLRLERDDEAVRIVTIHKSKGLEYPIVFCPYSWGSADAGNAGGAGSRPVLFHRQSEDADGESRSEHVCDFDSEDRSEHEVLEFRERLAEDLRLLYVALTRARNRCYLVWGAFNKSGASAAAWLLHGQASAAAPSSATLHARFAEHSDAHLRQDLDALVDASSGNDGKPTINVVEIPPTAPQPYQPADARPQHLSPRLFTGIIFRDWRICSFSTLTAGLLDESPDRDRSESESAAGPVDTDALEGIFAFPRGAAAGTCLHQLFEDLDFTEQNPETVRHLVQQTLSNHGFSPELHGEAVFGALQRTLDVNLDSRVPGLTLRAIGPADRLNEVEFLFPIERVTPALLANGLGDFASAPDFQAQLRRLNFRPAGGFLKGFIDLAFRFGERFHLVDWKSNWLGGRAEDYHQAALEHAMHARYYTLQHLLYTVALHRYLSLRLPGYDYEKHFGGTYYLFLRGIDPQRPDLGIVRARPPRAQIERLSNLLIPEGKGHC